MKLNLSGGAGRASFQGGVIYELHKYMKFEQIAALSGGAINAYFLATDQVEFLPELWTEILPKHAKKGRWILSIPFNLLRKKKGLVSSKFIQDLLQKYVHEIPENLEIQVVSLFTGYSHVIHSSDIDDIEEFRNLLYATMAIPGIFEPVGMLRVKSVIFEAADGGIYEPLPSTDSDIQILTHTNFEEVNKIDNVVDSILAALRLRKDHRFDSQELDLTNAIYPLEQLPNPADFSKKSLEFSFRHGQQQALRYLETKNLLAV